MAGAFVLLGSSKFLSVVHDQALFSFHGESENFVNHNFRKDNKLMFNDVFMDSGAFSADRQGIKLSIEKYATFINKWKDKLTVYANLDVIHDPEQTYKNQQILEKAGHDPLPVFHAGEDLKWLDDYVGSYDYIALGGMAWGYDRKRRFLDSVFAKYPDHKFHGFGVGDIGYMQRYPFHSVDSTTWFLGQKLGDLFFSDGTSAYYMDIPNDKMQELHKKGFSLEVIQNSYNARNIFNLLSLKEAMFNLEEHKKFEDYNNILEEFK